MKRPSSRALSAGALFGLLSVTPAFAQVAGNPGDLHTQTLYMQQYHGRPSVCQAAIRVALISLRR